MRYWINKYRCRWVLPLSLMLMVALVGKAQSARYTRVDIFMGAELHYRDLFHNKVYEALVNLTPGIKWYMGNQWQLTGQAIVPVYNDYGDRYKKVRLNMAVLSKEFDWRQKHFLKISGGLFGMERYGLDVKWMYPVNRWLTFDAQLGWTGFCSMAVDWECSRMSACLFGKGKYGIQSSWRTVLIRRLWRIRGSDASFQALYCRVVCSI